MYLIALELNTIIFSTHVSPPTYTKLLAPFADLKLFFKSQKSFNSLITEHLSRKFHFISLAPEIFSYINFAQIDSKF